MVFSVILMRKTTVQGWKRGSGGFLHTGSSAHLLWQVVPGSTYLNRIGNRIYVLTMNVFTDVFLRRADNYVSYFSLDIDHVTSGGLHTVYICLKTRHPPPVSLRKCNFFLLYAKIYSLHNLFAFNLCLTLHLFLFFIFSFFLLNIFAHVTFPLFICPPKMTWTDISPFTASVLSNIYVHSCVTYCTFPFCCISIFSPFTCMYNIFFLYLINFLTFWISNL